MATGSSMGMCLQADAHDCTRPPCATRNAVMLIDVVNTDQINRDFGRKAAEDRCGWPDGCCQLAREIDARLSERRFGMLVEGPFERRHARAPHRGLLSDAL
jgi:hypothetical protein